jgi:hypothetical protein
MHCAPQLRTAPSAVLCAMVLFMGLLVTSAHADLPSSVASRVKRINSALTAVDSALEKDQLMTAERKLKEANRYFKEIQDRYAGKFDEGDLDYAAMSEHLEQATARVEAAKNAEAAAEAAGAEAEAAKEALCSDWHDRLAPFVDYKSDQFLPIGADLNRRSAEGQAQAKAAFARAKVIFADYQDVVFPHGKTQTLQNVEFSLASALKYYGEMEAKAALEEACQEWVDQLAPYVDSGMGSPKWLIASPTVSTQQIKEQQAIFEEATMAFTAYQQAEFPLGKSFRLQQIEEDLIKVLEEFPKAMEQSRAMLSGDIGGRLDGVLKFLNRDTGWKTNTEKKPPTIMERDFKPLREAVADFAKNASASSGQLTELQAKLKSIEEKNIEHRLIRAERTFQYEDLYAGPEMKDFKTKAKEVAELEYKKGQVLHITVPSEEWAIENVLEFTDTTKTALRRRITRSVRAQVSVKDAAGKFWLQEIYLAQDQLPGGGWAKLKGHTTWADPMVEDNVGEFVPKPPRQVQGGG